MTEIRRLFKDACFFEPSKFKAFKTDIKSLKVAIQPKVIQELNLKCYGYGYFDD